MSILDPSEPFVFSADMPPVNTNESKVPAYTLPDPLKTASGETVATAKQWTESRRPEILELFRENMYGKAPVDFRNMSSKLETEVTEIKRDPKAIGGKATQYQIRFVFRRTDTPEKQETSPIGLHVYIPNKAQGKVPAFLGYNFQGNHTISDDANIILPVVWTRENNVYSKVPAKEETRGEQKDRWQVDKILDAGYALISAHYCDVVPDFPAGRSEGVQGLFDVPGQEPAPNDWGAIAAWAFGMSVMYDLALAHTEGRIDPEKVAVMGHSRLGKTALWAGANDERFAIVISNNSGCGGAALTRREFGETLQRMNEVFPHWLCGNCKKYNTRVNDLPIDQHELIALIAPRPVYVASAEKDTWADPRGEFLSCVGADPVYRLLGTEGLGGCTEMPPVDQPVGKTIGYHIRTGRHDVTEYDWDQYLRFANEHFGR